MQPTKAVKRAIKLLVNIIALLCAVILLVLVAATQTNDLPLTDVPHTSVVQPRPWLRSGTRTHTTTHGQRRIITDSCSLNVGAEGVCAYAYILGGIGLAVALIVIFLALCSCVTDVDTPVFLDGTLHALAALWWLIGVAVLGTFVARANWRAEKTASYSGEGARVGVVLTALVNAVLYGLSLWTNACCCIARYKHENVSMYV